LESASRINSEKYGYFIGAFCKRNSMENPFIKAALDRKLKVFPIYEFHSYDPTILLQIRRLIEREKIDIIHTHEVRSDIVGLACGKLCGVPVMTTLHGWIQNGFKGRLFTKIDKNILRFFDHVICVSERMKQEVCRFGVKQGSFTVLHNALVIENFQRNMEDRGFRNETAVRANCFLIGNIGRLSPEKGHADFIRAAAIVLKKYRNARFVLIGKGDDEHCLRELARGLGIENEIVFAGYRTDMVHIYNTLDLVVQSSYTEGMPNVILEALAMEVPVIATDVGGTSEAIENNKTGILISPGKPEELAEKIRAFIQNKDTFKEMAKKGRKHVEANFNFDERTQKLSLIYDRMASQATHSRILV
jgi:glycosyltransferase involved in cell wall biosynthesis